MNPSPHFWTRSQVGVQPHTFLLYLARQVFASSLALGLPLCKAAIELFPQPAGFCLDRMSLFKAILDRLAPGGNHGQYRLI